MKKEIIPAILTADPAELRTKLSQLEGLTHRVHIDIMDGIFVPHTTIQPEDLMGLDSILDIELHLMVVHPERYLEMAQRLLVRRVIVHVEAMQEPRGVMHEISTRGLKRCLAISPETPLEKLFAIGDLAEQITVMGVTPGAAGQVLNLQTAARIKEVATNFPHTTIEVDGGVHATTISPLDAAGAELFVANTEIFHNNEIENNLRTLRQYLS